MAVMRRTPRCAGRTGRCGGGRRRRGRGGDGDGGDTDAGALERGEHRRDGGRAAVGPGAQRAAVDERLADAGDARRGPDRSLVGRLGQLDDDGVAPQLGLQLVRRAVGDDPPVVDDRQPAGE